MDLWRLMQAVNDSDSEDEEFITNLPMNTLNQDLTLLVAISAKENQDDRTFFRQVLENFYRKPDILFKEYFRIDPGQFAKLTEDLRPKLERQAEIGRSGLPPELKVAVALIILGRGESFRGMEPFGVSKSAAGVAFHSFMKALIWKYGNEIRIPGEEEAAQFHQIFAGMAGNRVSFCPKIIGAVDGTHIRIRPPQKDAGPWINRKGFPSLNVQALVDGNCKFLHVTIGAPGRVNDGRVFSESGLLDLLPRDSIILGDAAYPLKMNRTLTPYRDNGHLSELQKRFNILQSSLRMVVERAFGILKKKWTILNDIQFLGDSARAHIIICCCILHNKFLNLRDRETATDYVPEENGSDEESELSGNSDALWRETLAQKMFGL